MSEIKRWMLQILSEVDSCYQNLVVHRDLKPCKLLIGDDGVLKLVDFGQARILLDPGYVPDENPQPYERSAPSQGAFQPPEVIPEKDESCEEGYRAQEQGTMSKEEYFRVLDEDRGAEAEQSHGSERQGLSKDTDIISFLARTQTPSARLFRFSNGSMLFKSCLGWCPRTVPPSTPPPPPGAPPRRCSGTSDRS
ncbi:hypothetical protein ACFX2F_006804 [Malus domestica]